MLVKGSSSLMPQVKIDGKLGNVKDPQYSSTFFSSFDVVLNALDNVNARRHVNRLCLATKRPLIEAGSMKVPITSL